MPGTAAIQHSVLIISGAQQFTALARASLPAGRFSSIEVRTDAAAARRCLLERDFDLVLIQAPLPGENGLGLALDFAENRHTSVLLAVPAEVSDDVQEQVTDRGILVIPRPATRPRIQNAVRFLLSIQDKMSLLMKEAADAREKTEEIRQVDRAKFVLIEHRHMSEDEAHRYIGKLAMNNGISRRRAAAMILDEYE